MSLTFGPDVPHSLWLISVNGHDGTISRRSDAMKGEEETEMYAQSLTEGDIQHTYLKTKGNSHENETFCFKEETRFLHPVERSDV